jgi:uncharacterized membrane protein
MNPSEFVAQLDDIAIAKAIGEAELTTSGEIRVFVTDRKVAAEEVMKRAAARFEKLGMTATRERNAVLLYFAPESQRFAIIGDQAIHEKCGQAFWDEVRADMAAQLKEHHFTEAVTRAVHKVAEVLARHFPRQPDDINELPNRVERDPPRS